VTCPTNAFLRGVTIGALVASGVAAAGALLAVLFLPSQPPRPASATAGESGAAEGTHEAEIQPHAASAAR
jgi:hypothetical protein